MCVILICPPQVRPSVETLRLCQERNPHGGGIAWRNGDSVEWFKSNEVAVIERVARQLAGEIVIHFRRASIGGVHDELRHPFPVSHDPSLSRSGVAKKVLFQNGTWTGWQEALNKAAREGHPLPKGRMNDTRAAAFLCSLSGPDFLNDCGVSRWVYFTTQQTLRFGKWRKREGIYFSNLKWLPASGNPVVANPLSRRWTLSGIRNYLRRLVS